MRYSFALLLFVFISSVNILQAETITVCSNCEIKTIKEAIAHAADFDTLLIKKGTFDDPWGGPPGNRW